jgi:hypothetical protein
VASVTSGAFCDALEDRKDIIHKNLKNKASDSTLEFHNETALILAMGLSLSLSLSLSCVLTILMIVF